jgi:hypothetical protein
MAKASEMSKSGYKGLRCAVCGRPVPLSGPAFQAETDCENGWARLWHVACGRPVERAA